ncbi:MAG TPA: ATP-binding protein [Lutibacter sp.]
MRSIDKKIIVAVVFISCIVLVGWGTGWLQLAQISKSFIPMPPSSALLFILSCSVLILIKKDNNFKPIKYLTTFLAYFLLVIAIYAVFDHLFFKGEFGTFLAQKQVVLGNVYSGQMSVITDVFFLIQSIVLVLLLKKMAYRKIIGFLASLLYFSSAFFIITYIENVPDLHQVHNFPISVLNSISFFLFSYALLAQINYQFWPFSHVYKSTIESRLILVFIPVIVVFILLDHLIKAHFNVNEVFGPLTSSILLYLYILITVSILLLIAKYFGRQLELVNNLKIKSETRFREIAENLEDVFWIISPKKFRFEYISPSAEKIFGTSQQEIYNNPSILNDIIHPDDKQQVLEALENSKSGNYDIEYRIVLLNGEIRWIRDYGSPIFNNQGAFIRLVGISSDITNRKEMFNELLVAKERAENSDCLKSAFLANISHEIRTPMNSILGFSELLMNKDISGDKQEKYHEIINASGNRLMNLISDIVDVSRIEAKELSLIPKAFNLNKLLDQLHHQFSISPKNKNTSIRVSKGLKDADSFINCEETRLAQILSNLLENALKFTHNGTIEFGYIVNEEILHFYVKDSGVGINAKDHQHIFERFYQSDNGILEVKDGTGLGLAISKGIVELMGGKIWVESEPYKGATFHFTKPYCRITTQDDKKDDNLEIEPKNAKPKTILIAEDEETNFWYLEAALENHPFNLIHVLNGKEAVDTMQNNNSIDLILMDFNMPVMNGLDATVEIRKTNSTIPIIALTAYALMADKEKALTIGCTDYLSKPVSKSNLLETINKHIHTAILN